jgi:C1A family cysteine protease
MKEFFASFDWRTYAQKNNLSSRIQAIAHIQKANKYSLKINKVQKLTLTQVQVRSKVPANVDLRSKLPACYDQGNLGSCTANAIVAAYQFLAPSFFGSRLFLYYNERVIENDVNYDNGAYIYDGVYSLETTGLCPESDWPYITSKFAQKPPKQAYTNALKHTAVASKVYNVQQTLPAMKGYLAAGFPFIVGIAVYVSFESQQAMKTGVVPLPPINKNDTLLGAHAILIVGYDDSKGWFIFRNSWGKSYGVNGYGFLPYSYLTNVNLTSDCWCIESSTK